MTMFYNITNRRPGASWRDRFEEIKNAREEYFKLESIMTPLEKTLISRSINDKKAEAEAYILDGARGEWHYAIDQVKKAFKEVQDAKNREVARWDATRLNAEMETAERLINKTVQSSSGPRLDPSVMPRIHTMYNEAQKSGDIYKMRAMAEVAVGLPAMVGNDFDDRKQASRLAQQAQDDAQAVRVTSELERAHRTAEGAVESLSRANKVLREVDEGLGYQNPNGEVGNFTLFRELSRVRSDQNGISAIVSFEDALNEHAKNELIPEDKT